MTSACEATSACSTSAAAAVPSSFRRPTASLKVVQPESTSGTCVTRMSGVRCVASAIRPRLAAVTRALAQEASPALTARWGRPVCRTAGGSCGARHGWLPRWSSARAVHSGADPGRRRRCGPWARDRVRHRRNASRPDKRRHRRGTAAASRYGCWCSRPPGTAGPPTAASLLRAPRPGRPDCLSLVCKIPR